MSTIQEIEEAIERLDVPQQLELLRHLPARLKLQPDDIAWLEASAPAFEFWDNPDDAAYDRL